MRLHIISDIHTETGGKSFTLSPDTDFDVLVAAGDIGTGASGVEWLKTLTSKPIVMVAGNHEFWGRHEKKTRSVMLQEIKNAAAGSNINFLENESVVIDGVRFLGCTLWTNYGGGHELLMKECAHKMNDYYEILTAPDMIFSPADALALHDESVKFLQQAIATPFDGETVVVTHHHPSYESLRKFGVPEKEISDSREWYVSRRWEERAVYRVGAYASDLEALLQKHFNEISVWICGHLHRHIDYAAASTRVVCNPRGYGTRGDAFGFDPQFIVDTAERIKAPIEAEVAVVTPRLNEIRDEIVKFSAHTKSKGTVRVAVQEAITSRAEAFRVAFSKVYRYAISNMTARHLAGLQDSGPAVDLWFHPAELGSQPTSQFRRLRLPEETVRLLTDQAQGIKDLQTITRLPELTRTEATRRIALGLHCLRMAGFDVQFHWSKNLAKKPWHHIHSDLGRLYVVAKNDFLTRAQALFDNYIRGRGRFGGGLFYVQVVDAPDLSALAKIEAREYVEYDYRTADIDNFFKLNFRFPDDLVASIVALDTPGNALKTALVSKGMDLNELMKSDVKNISSIPEILLGNVKIDSPTAGALETIVGQPAAYWMQLQADYDIKLMDICGVDHHTYVGR